MKRKTKLLTAILAAVATAFTSIALDNLDRSKFPSVDQGEIADANYRIGGGHCTINALVNGLLWWTEAGLLREPKGGKGDTLAARMTDLLITKYDRSGKTASFSTALVRGVFLRYVSDHADPRYNFNAHLVAPTRRNMAAAVHGGNFAVLCVAYKGRGSRPDESHAVTLVSVDPENDSITYNTWGKKYEHKFNSWIQANKKQQFGLDPRYMVSDMLILSVERRGQESTVVKPSGRGEASTAKPQKSPYGPAFDLIDD